MSGLTSPGTGRTYGTSRTCRAFGVSRSSYYLWSKRKDPGHPLCPRKKRGPKTTLTDDELLTLVRADLAAFVETYNAQWRLEKLGFMTPREAREQFGRALAA